MIEGAEYSIECLDPGEVKMAKVLIRNNKITIKQLNEFLAERNRYEQSGKRYLGDILVEKKFITQEALDEFFAENNQLYNEFCHKLVDEGFLRQEQLEAILAHEDASTNMVSALEKQGIMTRESFTKLFSKRVNALRLGDWLLTKKAITGEKLKEALELQSIYRLEDYLVYYKISSKELIVRVKEKLGLS